MGGPAECLGDAGFECADCLGDATRDCFWGEDGCDCLGERFEGDATCEALAGLAGGEDNIEVAGSADCFVLGEDGCECDLLAGEEGRGCADHVVLSTERAVGEAGVADACSAAGVSEACSAACAGAGGSCAGVGVGAATGGDGGIISNSESPSD